MKILIIRLSSIGDIVLTTPVVRCLKKQRGDAELHYLTKASFKALFAANPYIDKMHYVQDDIEAVIPQLLEENFDEIIDLHHNLKSLRIKKALKKPAHSFHKLNIEKWMLTALKINRLPDVHIVDRYLDTVKHLGVQNDSGGLDYFIPEAEKVRDEDIPASHLAGYVGVVIGAALATKQLPVDQLRELCKGIKHPLILLGGPEDRENGEAIRAIDPDKIYNACGKFKLNESADLVRRAKLIVTHDTGLMHIAAAFKKPIISIWGNTVPAFGMYPYYGKGGLQQPVSETVEVKGLWCRPCSKIGYKKCPLGHFNCMRKQDIPALIDRVHRRLGIS